MSWLACVSKNASEYRSSDVAPPLSESSPGTSTPDESLNEPDFRKSLNFSKGLSLSQSRGSRRFIRIWQPSGRMAKAGGGSTIHLKKNGGASIPIGQVQKGYRLFYSDPSSPDPPSRRRISGGSCVPKGRSEPTAVDRPVRGPISGAGDRRHWAPQPDRPPPV